MNNLEYGRSICYSGFREGQSPITHIYPTYEQVKEDLLILNKEFDYIRMYSPSKHAKTAVKVIQDLKLNLKVMVGIDLLGEISNPNCAWGGTYTQEQIKEHKKQNDQQLLDLIKLANTYEDIIFCVSAGNESIPEWNENLVSVDRVLHFVKELKMNTNQLVTYCENFHYWNDSLKDVAKELDIISIHTYPVWTGVDISDAISKTVEEYQIVKDNYHHKTVIITEAGWPTHSDDSTIKLNAAKIENHKKYISELDKWSIETRTPVFFFEAFDEPWKGSANMNEPEKHWGFFDVNRLLK